MRFIICLRYLLVTGSSPFCFKYLGYIYATCSSLGTWPLWTGSTTFDKSEPYLGLSLSSRRVREVNRLLPKTRSQIPEDPVLIRRPTPHYFPRKEFPASSSLFMDIDASEDYLRFINELERPPEHSPFRSSQAFVPDVLAEASVRQSGSYNDSSYDLSGVWQS
ncbi:hypothetical protein PIB30_015517 [Stylosanthes scabra]|uniref:Uncharacterized protein n=1 Tax=Stylosanthes scabra TaxID=79078 RepID=A0ABU6Y5A4_9FABA|nr:hypothetical protein [Stylosanthes scabra]